MKHVGSFKSKLKRSRFTSSTEPRGFRGTLTSLARTNFSRFPFSVISTPLALATNNGHRQPGNASKAAKHKY